MVALFVLDLWAGWGVLGFAWAKLFEVAHFVFEEIDVRLLPTIEKNCRQNNISPDRYHLYKSDLFTHIPDIKYDFILTNPPYIDPTLDRTEASVKNHEPHLALYGGENGMEIIESIISGARAKLAPLGQLWLEHEPEQSSAINTQAKQHGFLVTPQKDQYGLQRYTVFVLQ